MIFLSVSESSVNFRLYLSANFLWDSAESLLTPIISAPFYRKSGYLSANPHACFVHLEVLSLE